MVVGSGAIQGITVDTKLAVELGLAADSSAFDVAGVGVGQGEGGAGYGDRTGLVLWVVCPRKAIETSLV